MSEQAFRATCWHCGKYPVTIPNDNGLCEACYREMRHREHVAGRLPEAKAALEALRRLADTASGVDALKHALEMEHRTNQQLVCRALVALLEKWNADAQRGPGYYDARNEASVKFAEAVFENVPERKRYFPYI
jgi:predicted amidophosphoribosyltransferase